MSTIQEPVASAICTYATKLVEHAQRRQLCVRLFGGVAVALRCVCGIDLAPELARLTGDIDLVGLRRQRRQLEHFFADNSLVPHREFNALSGGERLLYRTSPGEPVQVRIDVVLDDLRMCHSLRLAERLDRHPLTISATDLLLTKLQVVFPSERDIKDILALIATFDLRPDQDEADVIDLEYMTSLCGADWGWHHTTSINLWRAKEWASLIGDDGLRTAVRDRCDTILRYLTACPKTLLWRLRNIVGERIRWFDVPEDAPTW